MQIKSNKVISSFLIILMLFLGMFYENSLDDSLFDCTTGNHPVSSIKARDAILIDDTICTIEMLGVKTISYVQQFTNNISQRIAIKTTFDYFLIDYILQFFCNFFLAVCILQLRDLYSQTVLVSYIHSKDGKK